MASHFASVCIAKALLLLVRGADACGIAADSPCDFLLRAIGLARLPVMEECRDPTDNEILERIVVVRDQRTFNVLFVRLYPPFVHVMYRKSFAGQVTLFYSIFQMIFESLLGLKRLPSQVKIPEHYDAEIAWMNEYSFFLSILMK